MKATKLKAEDVVVNFAGSGDVVYSGNGLVKMSVVRSGAVVLR